MCLNVARVHPFVEQVHGLALAGAVHAADQDDDREFGLLRQIELRIQQVFAQFGFFLVVGLLVDLVSELGRFKHESPC
jgi:hypothetical protein